MSVRNEFQDGEGRAFRFPENDDMRIGLLDLQRASWAVYRPARGEAHSADQGRETVGKFEEALL